MTVTQNVNKITITATQNGNDINIQPVIMKNAGGFDGIVDGGTP